MACLRLTKNDPSSFSPNHILTTPTPPVHGLSSGYPHSDWATDCTHSDHMWIARQQRTDNGALYKKKQGNSAVQFFCCFPIVCPMCPIWFSNQASKIYKKKKFEFFLYSIFIQAINSVTDIEQVEITRMGKALVSAP